jgi:hypothetical protein
MGIRVTTIIVDVPVAILIGDVNHGGDAVGAAGR